MRSVVRGRSRAGRTVMAAGVLAALLLAGCGSSSSGSKSTGSGGGSSSGGGADAKTATSAQAVGGMDALVAAAKKEGTLNVIALPPDWANYGAIIDAFKQKYGLKVVSAQPDAASQDEINAAKQLKGTSRAPDVFDLGAAVALANTAMYAPYKVTTWADIPENLKETSGLWVNDYGGYMSIGYDSAKVPAPTSLDDLLKPAYKGKVALNGDPTQAGAAFNGVVAAALASGGSADDISKGVDFFQRLKKAGNFLPVDPTSATVASGQTPVVFDWDYLNLAQGKSLKDKGSKVDWKTVVVPNGVVGSYYFQAINKNAPHPAAARLWEEFLYSDQGQNLWLAGYARPVRADAMVKAGTVDKAAYAQLPKAQGTPVFLTTAQTDKAKTYLQANWAKAIS